MLTICHSYHTLFSPLAVAPILGAHYTIEFTGKQRPEFIFEAKRLNTASHREAIYIGKEGLQRFIRGDYAARYSEAAMVAYVQDKTVADWETAVKKAIDKKARKDLRLANPQRSVSILSEFPTEWMSEHKRVRANGIAIYHIFLDCCP